MALENFESLGNKPESPESLESVAEKQERATKYVVDMFRSEMGPKAVLDRMEKREFKVQPSAERAWWNED